MSEVADVDELDSPVGGGDGRSRRGTMRVAGAVEVEGDAPGRIGVSTIADFSAAVLHGFVASDMAPGATIRTDGWSAYKGAPDAVHDPHVVGKMAAHVVLPWIHRVFANLNTWALGVSHGLRQPHLQSNLDELAFPLDRRKSRHAAFGSCSKSASPKTRSPTKC